MLLDKAVGTRLELPVFICAYFGLRRGELCGLRWSGVGLEHQTITIENTRTQAGKKEIEKGTKTASSTRTLYLPDTLCDMLKAAKENQQACRAEYKNAYDDNDYVVVMEDGKPFRPNYLSELFSKFLVDNDLPKIVLHEPLSEFLACQLAEQVCPAAVRYDLDFYYHKLISKCRLFTDEAHGLAKLSDFPDHPNSVSGLMKFYAKFGAEDVLRRIFVLDTLILNTDRHLGNFGFLFDNQTMEVKTAAPMFDHNRSLLFDLDEDQLARPDWYIVKCRPRIGVDFIKTAKGMLTDEIRQELKNLDGFRFAPHPTIELPKGRLEALNAVVERQRRAILE
ncbi:MAG: tyrosine-type recombinase/integrase [Butyricicoccus sp.]